MSSSGITELHRASAAIQMTRALTEAKQLTSNDFDIQQLILESIKLIGDELKTSPEKQAEFPERFVQITSDLVESLEENHRRKALSIARQAARAATPYKIVVMPRKDTFSAVLPSHFHLYDGSCALPNSVHTFDPSKPHTIPLQQYLEVRVSQVIQQIIKKGTAVDLFVGPINDMDHYYHSKGFVRVAQLCTRSSVKYFLFENEHNEKKVVIAGISNESKLTHTLLQLKALGIDLKTVAIRGDIQATIKVLAAKLQNSLDAAVGDLPIALAIIGNRSQLIFQIAKELYPEEMDGCKTEGEKEEKAEQILRERHSLQTSDIDGIFKFSTITLDVKGQPKAFIGMRMPNGDLARVATEMVLKRQNVEAFVMVGAGGSLEKTSGVGHYQLTTVSEVSSGAEPARLDPSMILNLATFRSQPICREDSANITVLSPLVETEEWLHQVKSKKTTSVDVETYFIMTAITQLAKAGLQTKVFPGLFVSDVVGHEPLVGKIDPSNAWAHLPDLLHEALVATSAIEVI